MKPVITIALCVVALTACEREKRENVYEPGGEFSERLDARGRRHIIQNADGEPIAKIRVRRGSIKVYDKDMTPLGEVLTADDTLRVERRGDAPVAFETTGVATELSARMRIEPVEYGWAVFDADARRLGYFKWLEDGRLALRDDYSSEPRVFARIGDAEARTPAGQVQFRVVPTYSAAVLLPFALDGAVDALDRVALGVWLTRERTKQVLAESESADAGAD